MSEIINVILTTEIFEEKGFAEFQRILFPAGEQGLVSCSDKRFDISQPTIGRWYGGEKYLEVGIYIGAFHEFDVERAVAAIRQVTWSIPESVQLFICRGREQRFTEVVLPALPDIVDNDEEEV